MFSVTSGVKIMNFFNNNDWLYIFSTYELLLALEILRHSINTNRNENLYNFVFVSECKDWFIYSSFSCCLLHWGWQQRKTNHSVIKRVVIAFEDFAKSCPLFFQYCIWVWKLNSLLGKISLFFESERA